MKRHSHHLDGIGRVFVLVFGLILLWTPVSSASGFQLKKGDTSGALGIGYLCNHLIVGIARNPSLADSMLRPIYQQGLQEIKKLRNLSKPEDIAHAIGIIRAGQILGVARNPSLADDLEMQAEQCFADIKMFKEKKRISY